MFDHDQIYENSCLAEDAVIGALLLDNTFIDEVTGEIDASDFLREINREAFKTIIEMQQKGELPADAMTVAHRITSERYTIGQMIEMLWNATKTTYAPANAKNYARMVKEQSTKRNISIMLIEAEKMFHKDNNNDDVLEFVRREIVNIENNNSIEIKSYSESLSKTLENLELHANQKNKLTGISTHFQQLDFMTNGLQPGSLVIVAARPSMGKTMLAGNIADNIARKEHLPVLFFSLEQCEEDLVKRTLSRFAKVSNIFNNNLNHEDWEKINMITPYLSESKLIINDRSELTISEIRSACRKAKNSGGLSAIFVDYLSYIAGEGENETLRVSKISASLKAIAKDFNIPVIALSQLNRGLEQRQDKRPCMADLRQSGAIEQDADLILFIYRDEYYNKDSKDKGLAEIIIAKNRNGSTGDFKLKFNPDFFEFLDYV